MPATGCMAPSSRRPSWDDYYLELASIIATRSTCLRRHVGAVIVKNRRILSSGYNGALSGMKHCEETGCLRDRLSIPSGERQEICRGLHAEQNAILQAAQYGIAIEGSALYCTHQPCIICSKMCIAVGIKRISFTGEYPDSLALDFLKEAGIEIIRCEKK